VNAHFMFAIYRNVCRSLFERHKLLFSFLMCVKVLMGDGGINPSLWRFLISGQGKPSDVKQAQPPIGWIETRMWAELVALSTLPECKGLAAHVAQHPNKWKQVFDSADAHAEPLPRPWHSRLDRLAKMCVLRCIRPDKMTLAVQAFVVANSGAKFIEPPPLDLHSCFDDSTVQTPLIFILSTGSDPTKAFYNFAEQKGCRRKVFCISLGQGQGALAARMIAEAQVCPLVTHC